MVYGATGYVGRATAALAVERGLQPVLAGRSDHVRAVAEELGTEAVVVEVDDAAGLQAALADHPVVLNCAGPFRHTYRQLAEACLATGTHYVDITGEPVVLVAAAAADVAARAAGVMLLPAAGFVAVPTDCLAVHLARRLPTASRLRLAASVEGSAAWGPGSTRSMLERAAYESSRLHRVDGRIVEADPRPSCEVDFGTGPQHTVLFTASEMYLCSTSTGIPNIDGYLALSPEDVKQLELLARMRWLLRLRAIRQLLARQIPSGATAAERAATAAHIWGEVVDDEGNRAISLIHGPEPTVVWTSRCSLDVVGHVLAGDAPPGYQTPATAYGPDLVLEADGVTREDVTEQRPPETVPR